MCGIAGFFRFGDGPGPDRAFLERALKVIAHRGPDDEGLAVLEGGRVGIGMRRLSIIDLVKGSQPMYSDDRATAMVFNGEMYNYPEVRRTLPEAKFRTDSDTEVFLRLYERRGMDGLAATRGMFAAAIWDTRAQRLVLVRDRFGKKPLYYWFDDGCLVFASEIKAILEYARVPRRLDRRALDHYLTWLAVPEPDTMFAGIRKLPPGHYLEIGADGRRSLTRYWQLSFPRAPLPITRNEAKDMLLHHANEAVRIRLRSDVPLGVLLSGGVDSSAIVALASRQSGKALKTFTIGFDVENFDEFEYSRAVATRYQTDHAEIIMPAASYWETLQDMVWHLDEPMADTATVPLYHVCAAAKQSVTVLLSGEGSDEMLAGYSARYQNGLRHLGAASVLGRHLPLRTRQRLWRSLAGGAWPGRHRFLWRLTQMIEYQFLKDSVYGYYEGLREPLYQGGAMAGFEPDESDLLHRLHNNGSGLLDRLLYTDTSINLPAYLLMKADKMSMAASVELRCPFLDHEYGEFCASLPSRFKLDEQTGQGKALLKQAMEPFLPHDVLYRPKMGFPVPIDQWLRGDLRSRVHDLLFDPASRIAAFLNVRHVRNMWTAHQEARQTFGMQLWLLVLLELWMRRFQVET